MTAAVSLVPMPQIPMEDHPWAALGDYGVRTPAEVLAEETGELFLIDGILHSSLTLLYGASEVGKTFLAVSLARALIDGDDWMGHRLNGGPGRVLILSSDPGGVREYSERLGGENTEPAGVTRPPAPDPELWKDLADRCRTLDVRLVVVD